MSTKPRLADLPIHAATGLRLMQRDYSDVPVRESHTVELPECCPVSHNPKPGSTLTLTYRPVLWVLEVYSLRSLIAAFRGGFAGNDFYPAERNMEGMIQLIAAMCADALQVQVRARADLVLDTGGMALRAIAKPRAVPYKIMPFGPIEPR